MSWTVCWVHHTVWKIKVLYVPMIPRKNVPVSSAFGSDRLSHYLPLSPFHMGIAYFHSFINCHCKWNNLPLDCTRDWSVGYVREGKKKRQNGWGMIKDRWSKHVKETSVRGDLPAKRQKEIGETNRTKTLKYVKKKQEDPNIEGGR